MIILALAHLELGRRIDSPARLQLKHFLLGTDILTNRDENMSPEKIGSKAMYTILLITSYLITFAAWQWVQQERQRRLQEKSWQPVAIEPSDAPFRSTYEQTR